MGAQDAVRGEWHDLAKLMMDKGGLIWTENKVSEHISNPRQSANSSGSVNARFSCLSHRRAECSIAAN